MRRHPERWAMLLGDAAASAVHIEWVAVPASRRTDRFLAPMGDVARARRLVRFAPRGSDDHGRDARQAARWRDEVANQRIHATTRERPADRLLVERPCLRKLPTHAYDTDLVVPLVVSKEARLHLVLGTPPTRWAHRSPACR